MGNLEIICCWTRPGRPICLAQNSAILTKFPSGQPVDRGVWAAVMGTFIDIGAHELDQRSKSQFIFIGLPNRRSLPYAIGYEEVQGSILLRYWKFFAPGKVLPSILPAIGSAREDGRTICRRLV